jgi:DNA polymerase III delta subunit
MARRRGALGPFVVSYGTEDYFLDDEINRARAWKDRDVRILDGARVDSRDIVSACETMGLDGADRVVILDNANKVKADKVLKAYVAGRAEDDDSVILFVICRSADLPEIWADAGHKGKIIEYRRLKDYESNNEVVKWISLEATELGIVLDDGIPEMLYRAIGHDLYRLAGELRKLAILVGHGGHVNAEHVRLVVAPLSPVDPGQVADATFHKDVRGALNKFSLLYRQAGEDAVLPVVGALMRQAERLAVARQLVDRGSSDDVHVLLNLNQWWCRTFFLPVVSKHNLPSLIGAMERLARLDADVKGPSQCRRTLLELAIIAIAQGACGCTSSFNPSQLSSSD